LQRFPIDVLKIDKSFVWNIDSGPEESALARARVRLGPNRTQVHVEAQLAPRRVLPVRPTRPPLLFIRPRS
jgi:predicted signal transduction protein with EAL and GGDEF domain